MHPDPTSRQASSAVLAVPVALGKGSAEIGCSDGLVATL